MAASWPPQRGELWVAADRWPGNGHLVEIPGGTMLVILRGGRDGGAGLTEFAGGSWWDGEVLAPGGKRWIKATEDDLIPGDDPRLCALAS